MSKPAKVPRLNTHARDWYDYSNRLERELAEVTRQRDAFRDELSKVMPEDYKDWWENDKNEWPLVARLTIENKDRLIQLDHEINEVLHLKLAKVTKQRDLLIEGLEKLADCDLVITLPDRMDAVREIARQTIQIAKNNEL